MEDSFIRCLSGSGGVRVVACTVAVAAREICTLQNTSMTAGIAIGRAVAAGALMGALLKGEERIALKFEGNGPVGRIIVEADGDGSVRASAGNPGAEMEPVDGRWDVPGLLGRAGFLTVSRDPGTGAEPYRGMVQLRSSEIGDDLAGYLAESEQTPSAVGVGARLDGSGRIAGCGGFLVQRLPGCSEHEMDAVAENIKSLPPLVELLSEGGPEMLVERLFDGLAFNILETREIFFSCGCSREKSGKALHLLGEDELKAILLENGKVEVTCEFCRKSYAFASDEISGASGKKSSYP